VPETTIGGKIPPIPPGYLSTVFEVSCSGNNILYASLSQLQGGVDSQEYANFVGLTPGSSRESLVTLKKASSGRRNAWGPKSYADLITQAIETSPEQRLTLAQIYVWMTSNMAYFSDRGDVINSAGWKVNLCLAYKVTISTSKYIKLIIYNFKIYV